MQPSDVAVAQLLFWPSKTAFLLPGEKQAATHISLDQEYDSESSQQWKELEEQVVSVINKGTIPSNFQPTQFCLNRYSDNSKFPLAVVEGKVKLFTLKKKIELDKFVLIFPVLFEI